MSTALAALIAAILTLPLAACHQPAIAPDALADISITTANGELARWHDAGDLYIPEGWANKAEYLSAVRTAALANDDPAAEWVIAAKAQRVGPGMPEKYVALAWGYPDRITARNSTSGHSAMWEWGAPLSPRQRVYILDGRVTEAVNFSPTYPRYWAY